MSSLKRAGRPDKKSSVSFTDENGARWKFPHGVPDLTRTGTFITNRKSPFAGIRKRFANGFKYVFGPKKKQSDGRSVSEPSSLRKNAASEVKQSVQHRGIFPRAERISAKSSKQIKGELLNDRRTYQGHAPVVIPNVSRAAEKKQERSILEDECSHQVSDHSSSSGDHPKTPTSGSTPPPFFTSLLDASSLDDSKSVVDSPADSPVKSKDKSEESPSTAKPADTSAKEKNVSGNSNSTGTRVIDFHSLCADFNEVDQALKEAAAPALPGATYETEFDAATRDSYGALSKTCFLLHGAQFKPPAGMEWFASGRLNAYVHALCAALPSQYRQIEPNVTWEFCYDVKEKLIVANFSVQLSPIRSLKGGFEFSVDSANWRPLDVTIQVPAAPVERPTHNAPVSKVSASVTEEPHSSDSEGADQVAPSAAEIAERAFDTLKKQKAAALQKNKSVGRLFRKNAQKALDVAEIALSKDARAIQKREVAEARYRHPVDWTIGTCLGVDNKGNCPVNKGQELPFLERVVNDQCNEDDDFALEMMKVTGSFIPSFNLKSYAQGLLDCHAFFSGRIAKDSNVVPLPTEMMSEFGKTAPQGMSPGEWLDVLIHYAAKKEKYTLPNGFPDPSKKTREKAAIWGRLAAGYRMRNLCSARSYTLAWEAMDRNIEAKKVTQYRPASQASEEED